MSFIPVPESGGGGEGDFVESSPDVWLYNPLGSVAVLGLGPDGDGTGAVGLQSGTGGITLLSTGNADVSGAVASVAATGGDLTLSGSDDVWIVATDDININCSSELSFTDAGGAITLTTIRSNYYTVFSNRRTGNYTIVLTDAGKEVEMNVAGANTLTVPPNSSVAFLVGTVITGVQWGAGQTTITPGAGVTLRSSGDKLKTSAQYAAFAIRKVATDEWLVSGDLVV